MDSNNDTTARTSGRPRKADHDPRAELHKRLDAWLDNPMIRSNIDRLTAGMVDHELRFRLTAMQEKEQREA
ncbi:hypothetical protein [Ralstonia pseudosolanacearum]